MGMNAVILILNDRLHNIRDDPDFGRKVADSIMGWSNPETDELRRRSLGMVISVAHADYQQLTSVAGNIGRILTEKERNAVRSAQTVTWNADCCAAGHHLFDVAIARSRGMRCRCGKYKGFGERNASTRTCANCRSLKEKR